MNSTAPLARPVRASKRRPWCTSLAAHLCPNVRGTWSRAVTGCEAADRQFQGPDAQRPATRSGGLRLAPGWTLAGGRARPSRLCENSSDGRSRCTLLHGAAIGCCQDFEVHAIGSRLQSTAALRRSREITILCPPKVTQHHAWVTALLPLANSQANPAAQHSGRP
jgi:hypothetical protein